MANQNRTIRIEEHEVPELEAMLSTKGSIADGFTDRIVNADLLEVIDSIPDSCANLIIIDPPYNLTRDFGEKRFNAMKAEQYDDYLRSWFHKVCKKLAPDGSLYMCGDWKCTASMQKVIEEELTIVNRITWQREKGRGAKNNWKNSMEDIWFAVMNPSHYFFDVDAVKMKRTVLAPYKTEGKPKDWEESDDGKFRITYPSNFWDDITVPFWSMPENTDHPTQKPEKLYAKLILASSRPGDLVFDPFLGSGTSAVVAKKLGRHFLGIEIDKHYAMLAAKRVIAADANATIQGYEDGVFWERNTLRHRK